MAQIVGPTSRCHDSRIIIHFDYDCFYAAVFEREDPKLRQIPFAVQQKQIIVTCNYEARRRGLYKLQLVKDARKKCPDVIIALGEDLTRFRNASKDNYLFLRKSVWSQKVERLGFDEVFMDVTEMVEYNLDLLNQNAPRTSFFHLDRNDPTAGFPFDATHLCGHTFPAKGTLETSAQSSSLMPVYDSFLLRLCLGSHLAQHLRYQLEEHTSFTCTVGISTNKLLSKLVGNLNKPKGQTTLLPPYAASSLDSGESNVTRFLDSHDIGKVPGVGFKMAQKIRQRFLNRPAAFQDGLVYGPTKEQVSVRDVRLFPEMSADVLERLLAGPGTPKGLGGKVWGWINGVDDAEVAKAKDVPQQISIEDSYIKLDTMSEVKRELMVLASSLIKRMRLDLTTSEEDDMSKNSGGEYEHETAITPNRWLARPQALRLSTRPRPPRNPDGSRQRIFNRISKTGPMPSAVFSFKHDIGTLAEKLVNESLLPLFRQLHPEKSGWDLSLVNLCATNIVLVGMNNKDGAGRDIGHMFRRQDEVLKHWKVKDTDTTLSGLEGSPADASNEHTANSIRHVSPPLRPNQNDHPIWQCKEDIQQGTQSSSVEGGSWDNEVDASDDGGICVICGAIMPSFAMIAHQQFHSLPD